MVLRDGEHIHNALLIATNIFCYEGFNKIQLRYNSNKRLLYRIGEKEAYKLLCDVRQASYSQELGAWEIVWLV